ncbi:MAG: Gfo/Idh/MocA family oxidoreductase [Candidatus Hydrogenedentes bacterium]|nr:Gfo/Idh/MocA family oxidoreductase [Candidatus Hydrogenedentota bacterium]
MPRLRRPQTPVSGNPVPRVAVIGAGGIGKHHAKWWSLCGAEVCAIAGSTRASVARAKTGLQALFDFQGRTYAGVDTLLRHETPDIVDVCSPPSLHYAHVDAALNAGCDVLCEKPFVFDPSLSADTLMGQAQSLVDHARRKGRRLSVCCQYAQGAKIFRQLWLRNRQQLEHFRARLETPARDRTLDPRRIWVDLAPHPISALLALAPSGHVDWTTVSARFDRNEATAQFQYPIQGAVPITCELTVRNTTKPPKHVRHFALNDFTFDIDGVTDASGIYRTRIATPNGHIVEMDMMHALICDFLHSKPVVDSRAMLANLAIMLRILEVST